MLKSATQAMRAHAFPLLVMWTALAALEMDPLMSEILSTSLGQMSMAWTETVMVSRVKNERHYIWPAH